MPAPSNPNIERLTDAVVSAAHPRLVLLLGSRAQGTHAADSDVDVLVVHAKADWNSPSRRAEAGRIRRAISNFGRPVDILLLTPEEFDAWKGLPNHIAYDAATAGRILYERP